MTNRRTIVKGALMGTVLGSMGVGTAVAEVAPAELPSERLSRHDHDSLLIRDGTVVTQDAELGVISRGDVWIYDGRIAAVGHNVRHYPRNTRIIDARGFIVMPGFVDNHRHLWTRLFAGVSIDQTFGPYFQLVSQRASQRLTPEHLHLAGYVGGVEALYSGVTTVLDWNHACYTREHAHASIDGLHKSGVRWVFGYAAPSIMYGRDVPPTEQDITSLKRVASHRKMHIAIPPRSPRQADGREGAAERIIADIELARALGVTVTMHTGLDTSEDLKWLLDRGLVGPETTLIHANKFTRDDFKAVADVGGWISSSPEVEMQMFGLPMPLGEMVDAGVGITLSSDLPASQRSDLLTQGKFALQVQRLRDWQAVNTVPELRPTSIITPWVTMAAARSLGMADDVGSLTPGKYGDVILVNAQSPNTLGMTDPIGTVFGYATPSDIDTVIVGGKIYKQGGQMRHVDADDLDHAVRGTQRELLTDL